MIIQSIILSQLPQIDGRTIIREQHKDDLGNLFIFDYMADEGFDVDQRLQDSAGDDALFYIPTEAELLTAEKKRLEDSIQIQTENLAVINIKLNPDPIDIGEGVPG